MRRLLPILLLLGTTRLASAGKGMPLDATEMLFDGEKAKHDFAEHIDADGVPGGKTAANAHSRLELELKIAPIRIKDEESFKRMRAALDQLSKDPALAAKVLGEGWYVEFKREALYTDTYLDNGQRALAKNLAGNRLRLVNGKDLELNTKPPGGLVTGPGGIFLTRAERGVTLGAGADLKRLARSKSKWNPVEPLHSLPGVTDPAELMDPSIQLSTKRGRYVLGYKGGDESWKNLIDLSADHVFEIKDVRPGSKAKIGKPAPIFSLEGDLNHPGQQSGLAIPDIEWEGPHQASDAHRPEFHQDPAVQAVHVIGPKLLEWLRTEHGVQYERALPKQTQAALNLGLFEESDIVWTSARKTTKATKPAAKAAAKPVRRGR
jgi:hypothetical protein